VARITWLGHATVLVELPGMRVLTDPVLRGRFARLRPRVPRLPVPRRLDAVLISQLHRDHADGPSLRKLREEGPALVPAGTGQDVRRLGARDVVEMEVGERVPVAGGEVLAVPAAHEERRTPSSPHTPALGFVIEGGLRVYFAGDTDLFEDMAALGPLDVALLPIWGFGSTPAPGHLDPERAARAVDLLRPRVVVPMHWGTEREDPRPEFAAFVAEFAPWVWVTIPAPGGAVELPGPSVTGLG
jgi:L-ascorbate metabolism protein UlaG (beta-lactamase superfamily)